MTKQEFLKYISGGRCDLIGLLLALLEKSSAGYCLIGGIAVNAYAEPVVSLDLGLILASDKIDSMLKHAV